MAIGTPTTPILKATGTNAATITSSPYVPPANCVLIAFGGGRGASALEPTISDTGATWTEIPGAEAAASGAEGKLWMLEVGASPPTLETTITSTGATQVILTVTDFPGGAVHATNIHVATSSTGDPAVTMDAFGANSAGYGCAIISGGDARPPPTGYTELLDDGTLALSTRVHVCYDLTSPGTDISWSGGGVSAVAIGVEIVEASAGSTDALLADDVATGAPSVGSPVIGQIHALGANDVATAAPSVGSPVLGQVHALLANDVATGVPTVGAPVLAEVAAGTDALLADDVSAGVPTVGTPSLGQVHVLTANDVTAGVPSVGAPSLSDGTVQESRDTGGSGNRRNINDDPEAFQEMLQEWRQRANKKPENPTPEPVVVTEVATEQDEEAEIAQLLARVAALELVFDNTMALYVAVENARQEREARAKAMRIAVELEQARLAWEAFLDDEDDLVMLLAA